MSKPLGHRQSTDNGKRINFRSNAEIDQLVEDIKKVSGESRTSEVIRTAVTIATLCWCEYKKQLLLRDAEGNDEVLSIPPDKNPTPKLNTVKQVRSDGVLLNDLENLSTANFGKSYTAIIRRSLDLYQSLLEKKENGWRIGHIDDSGHFALVPVLEFIRPRRDEKRTTQEFTLRQIRPFGVGAFRRRRKEDHNKS
jgi:hypothetical protein